MVVIIPFVIITSVTSTAILQSALHPASFAQGSLSVKPPQDFIKYYLYKLV